MRNRLLLLFVVALMSNCKDNVDTEKLELEPELEIETSDSKGLNDFKWILGEWIHEEDEMISKEIWSKKNDNTFTGFSFRLLRKDTVFAEKMVLQDINDDLLLTVTTIDQNQEDDPVSFKLISLGNKQFVFENKKHDFPKRITYSNPVNDKIHAWIEGDVLGENKKIDFHYSRKK